MKALAAIGIKKAMRFVWYTWYAWLIHVSLPPLRAVLLRIAGCRVGTDTVIGDVRFINLYHYGFSRLRIGNRCFLGDEVLLDARGSITLEDDVTVSHRVNIISHINVGYSDHPLQKHFPTKESPVVIERGSYIGTSAIILPGITIGAKSAVGAGSVVTKSIPASVVAVGVPARVMRKIG
jgi:acetyltransferase-like isoleucine patch superfamily enzyme